MRTDSILVTIFDHGDNLRGKTVRLRNGQIVTLGQEFDRVPNDFVAYTIEGRRGDHKEALAFAVLRNHQIAEGTDIMCVVQELSEENA